MEKKSMPSRDLRALLVDLDARGQLARVKIPVRSDEIAIIAAHAERRLNPSPALLFDHVLGGSTPYRAVMNLTNTPDRMAWALHVETLDDLRLRVEKLVNLSIPRGSTGMIERLMDLMEIARSIGVSSNPIMRKPPVQDIVLPKVPDIKQVPVFPPLGTAHNGDDAVYTWALLVMHDPFTDQPRYHATPAYIVEHDTLAVCLDPDEYARLSSHAKGESIPAAVVLGADPTLQWAIGLPLSQGFDQAIISAWLRGRYLPQAKGVSQSLLIPANAEAVFEGTISGTVIMINTDYGQTSGEERFYSLKVSAITHRERPIIPLFQHSSASELLNARTAAAKLFEPILKWMLPHFDHMQHLTPESAVAFVRVCGSQALIRLGFALWGVIPHLREIIVMNSDSQTRESAVIVTEQGARLITHDEALHYLTEVQNTPPSVLPPLPERFVWEDFNL